MFTNSKSFFAVLALGIVVVWGGAFADEDVIVNGLPCNSFCQSWMGVKPSSTGTSAHEADRPHPAKRPSSKTRETLDAQRAAAVRHAEKERATRRQAAAEKRNKRETAPPAQAPQDAAASPAKLASGPASEREAPPAEGDRAQSAAASPPFSPREDARPKAAAPNPEPAKSTPAAVVAAPEPTPAATPNEAEGRTPPAEAVAETPPAKALAEAKTAEAPAPSPSPSSASADSDALDRAAQAAARPDSDAVRPGVASPAAVPTASADTQNKPAEMSPPTVAALDPPASDATQVMVVLAKPEAQTVADLKDKTVELASGAQLPVDRLSASFAAAGATGLAFKPGAPNDVIEQLRSGKVAAAIVAIADPKIAAAFHEISGYKLLLVTVAPNGAP